MTGTKYVKQYTKKRRRATKVRSVHIPLTVAMIGTVLLANEGQNNKDILQLVTLYGPYRKKVEIRTRRLRHFSS